MTAEALIHQSNALQVTLKRFQGSTRHTDFAYGVTRFLSRDTITVSSQEHLNQLCCVAGIKPMKQLAP